MKTKSNNSKGTKKLESTVDKEKYDMLEMIAKNEKTQIATLVRKVMYNYIEAYGDILPIEDEIGGRNIPPIPIRVSKKQNNKIIKKSNEIHEAPSTLIRRITIDNLGKLQNVFSKIEDEKTLDGSSIPVRFNQDENERIDEAAYGVHLHKATYIRRLTFEHIDEY